MFLHRVHTTAIPPQIIELISAHSTRLSFRRCGCFFRRHLSSEVPPAPGILSEVSGLLHGQQLKPNDAEAEAHNLRLSNFRIALGTRKVSNVLEVYDTLVKHGSEAAIMGRDFEDISRMLAKHYSNCYSPRQATIGAEELTLRAAAKGYPAGLKACLLLHLNVGDVGGVLSIYNRFRYPGRGESVDESNHHAISRPSDMLDSIEDDSHQNQSNSDATDIAIIMIAAHAIKDQFDAALENFLATPMTIRLLGGKVQAFCRAHLRHDTVLSTKVQKWIEQLVFLRLMSREKSLNNHISALGEDKQTSSLEKLYATVITTLRDVHGRLVVAPDQGSERKPRRRTIIMPRDSWGSFVEAFFRCHRSDLVETLWNDVAAFGLTPDRHMWSALIEGYGRQGNCDRAIDVWNRMLKAGIEPDELSYGAMISAYFTGHRPNEGFALFQQFRNVRMETAVDRDSLTSPRMLRLFNIVLHGLCLNTKDDLARSLIKEMSEHGPTPDIVSYNTFLRHYERIGDMTGVAGTLRTLRSAGVQPDVHSFTTVLSALYKAGKPDAHAQTLKIMKALGVQPNVATYSAIIHFLARQGGEENLRKAGELLGQMENDPDKGSRPNEVTYTGMLAGIHRDETISPEASQLYTAELLDRMRSQGKPPNRTTYHILIKACLENSQPVGLERALYYYHEMRRRGIKLLHDTWYITLAGLLRRRDLEIAGEIIKDMFQSGHEPNSSLSTLVSRVQREIVLSRVQTP